ncbi:Hypothetical predicted protein [Pelobates cultripes]|uniref:Uncharacterized protein n=1 Tax=Pelobates cultripes TaxID=61616 RepID=A0AAD1RKQ6_PELCU|nr:Hypothetical predicted protein [Pelobates cultripes]CAH2273413.1 Hypothetical predicted protein [Pelobates cultripes]
MPFFLPPVTKHKRKPTKASHASSPRSTTNNIAAWGDLDWSTPEPRQIQPQKVDEMRRETQKSHVQTPKESQDIGTLLQSTPRHRVLEQADTVVYNPLTEDSVNMDASGPEPPTPVNPVTTTPASMVPATKQDIDNLFIKI